MALKLPRFLRDLPIVNLEKGTPTLAFHQWWESVLRQIETTINGIQAALDAAGIAQAAAASAQSSADLAASVAGSAATVAKLSNSGISNLAFTATDAGSSATITISTHTRVYGDGTSVSVNGGSLTGQAYNTTYYVFYNDPSFAGGTVTYQVTTTQADAAQTGSRHLVGSIKTPLAGAGPADGGSPGVPGFGFETVAP